MASKSKEPDNMMRLFIGALESQDLETAALIRPLPAAVAPSHEFVARMRLQLLELMKSEQVSQAA